MCEESPEKSKYQYHNDINVIISGLSLSSKLTPSTLIADFIHFYINETND